MLKISAQEQPRLPKGTSLSLAPRPAPLKEGRQGLSAQRGGSGPYPVTVCGSGDSSISKANTSNVISYNLLLIRRSSVFKTCLFYSKVKIILTCV